jgi:hypothetical protein
MICFILLFQFLLVNYSSYRLSVFTSWVPIVHHNLSVAPQQQR